MRSISLSLTMTLLVILVRRTVSAQTQCDPEVLECIQANNNVGSPALAKTFVKTLRTRDYSVVWHSRDIVAQNNLSCITTEFTPSVARDHYWVGCEKVKEVTYSAKMDFKTKVLSVENYEEQRMEGYLVYLGSQCMAYYVCNPTGSREDHIKVYCPTRGDQTTIAEELQNAREKLAACNIDDGIAICDQTCP